MMLTPKEIFKVAFLKKAAEAGLTLEETHECVKHLLTKQAWNPLAWIADLGTKAWDKGLDVGADALKTGTRVGLGTALIAPPALGFAAGHGLAAMTDVSDEDAGEAKKRQLIAEYQRLAKDIQNRKKVPLIQ
jgi:hypothetical protein